MRQYPGSTYFAPKSINRVTIQSVGGKAFDAGGYLHHRHQRLYGQPAATPTTRFVNASANYDLGIAMDEVVMEYITEVLGGTVTADKYGEATGRIHVLVS